MYICAVRTKGAQDKMSQKNKTLLKMCLHVVQSYNNYLRDNNALCLEHPVGVAILGGIILLLQVHGPSLAWTGEFREE